MEPAIKRQLPGPLQLLADEIEGAAGAAIEVRVGVPNPSGFYPQCMSAQIDLDPVRMTVFCPQGLGVREPQYPELCSAFAHELLHLRRTFVERVPAIYQIAGMAYYPSCRDEQIGVYSVCGLESAIEHIVIEPLIAEYGIEHQPDFIRADAWMTVPPRPWRNERLQRWMCMGAWIKTQFLTPDESTRETAERVMERVGLLADARELTDQLRRLRAAANPVRGKELMSLHACAAFEIEPAEMKLFYYRKPAANELWPLASRLQMAAAELIPGGIGVGQRCSLTHDELLGWANKREA